MSQQGDIVLIISNGGSFYLMNSTSFTIICSDKLSGTSKILRAVLLNQTQFFLTTNSSIILSVNSSKVINWQINLQLINVRI